MNSDTIMHDIIDELNPNYKPTSDEHLIYDQSAYGVFQRKFKHVKGEEFLVQWTVYYGTPETVKTVFNDVKTIEGEMA